MLVYHTVSLPPVPASRCKILVPTRQAAVNIIFMQLYFTICSNNYLAQAAVLHISLKQHVPGCRFLLFLCDTLHAAVDYTAFADETIPLASIEPAIDTLAAKYTIAELNACLKPRVMEYLFTERMEGTAVYLDPDIKVYAPLPHPHEMPGTAHIVLTPHIYTPIEPDGNTPSDNTFLLQCGVFNLGYIGLRNTAESMRFIRWWKQHTYERGYAAVGAGVFTDQLPVNLVPIFFKHVEVMDDMGCNMAPWNLHERKLSPSNEGYLVNGELPLRFFHFSSFDMHNVELPLEQYNRFMLRNRPDLQELYYQYKEDLINAGYETYSQLLPHYSQLHKEASRKQAQWLHKWLGKKHES